MKKYLGLLVWFIPFVNFSYGFDIWDSINNLTLRISNFFDPIINVVWYIISIVKTLWFWLTSLLTSSFELFKQIFEWEAITTTAKYFGVIWEYIWGPATVFLASLFVLIILRIWIAFVFKIFRMNLDYKISWKKSWKKMTKKDFDDLPSTD